MSSAPASAAAAYAASPAPVTPERIMQFMWGYAPPMMLETAVRTGIFDRLAKSPATAETVAADLDLSLRGTRGLLHALVGFNFLERDDAGRFSNGPEAAKFLISASPASLAGLISHNSRAHIPSWLKLEEVVRTGRPVVHAVNQEGDGTTFFHQLVSDIFPMSFPAGKALQAHLGLTAPGAPVSVLDIAAGAGTWGIALAQGAPRVSVTAVDWPGILPVLREHAERFGVADRVRTSAGDLLSADFGRGHHLAVLGHILHSEGEARSRELLKKVAAAVAPGGTIAIAEFLVDDDRRGPVNGLIFALNMLVNTDHGDTYSVTTIAGWLAEAGFADVRTLAAPGPSPLILATRV
jgi:SAM-dependent methyltransferase